MSDQSNFRADQEGLVLRYLENQRPDLKDMIMVEYSGLVERIARRFSGLEQQEDLVQVGFIGLLNALNKFDPSAGVRFNTYATHLVAGEIKHYLRDKTQTIRQPAWLQELRHKVTKTANMLQAQHGRQVTTAEIAEELKISESAIEEVFQTQELLKVASLDQSASNDDDGSSDMDQLDATDFGQEQLSVEERVVLERAVQQLRDLERGVLVMFHFEAMSQTEIAHKLGISCNYVSHILRQSLGKLRRILTNEEASDRILKKQTAAMDDDILDPLTGVYSEAYFNSRVAEEVHRATSNGTPVAFIGLDFEGLGTLRDYYGDVCVQDFIADAADFLKETVRRLDVVSRFGDTGFAVILPSTNISAEVVLQRLLAKMENWLENRRGPAGKISVVAKTATVPAQGTRPEQVIKRIQSDVAPLSKKTKLRVTEGRVAKKQKAA